MKKSALYILSSLIICLLVIILGKQFYDAKVEKAQEASKPYAIMQDRQEQKQAKKEQQLAAEKRAEAKRVYNAHKGHELVYVPMGDSLAEGWYATTKSNDYVSVLSDMINNKMGYDVQTKQGVVRAGTGLRDYGLPNVDTVIADRPDFVTIEFGTNDLQKNIQTAYSSPSKFKSLLLEVISRLKSAPKIPKIVLVTTWNGQQGSLEYDSIIEKVGKQEGVPVANIQTVWMGRSDTRGPVGEKSFAGTGKSDGWHPNDDGHKEIAQIIYQQAYSVLK